MWKFACVLTLCLTVHSAPLQDQNAITYTRNSEIYNENTNSYKFNFDISNGITRDELGLFKDDGKGEKEIFVTGSYSFRTPEGKLFHVMFSAGKEGYRPVVKELTGITTPPPAAYPGKPEIDSKLLCSLCG